MSASLLRRDWLCARAEMFPVNLIEPSLDDSHFITPVITSPHRQMAAREGHGSAYALTRARSGEI